MEVSEVIDLGREEIETLDRENPFRWLMIQAEGSVEQGDYHYRVKPLRVIAFSGEAR